MPGIIMKINPFRRLIVYNSIQETTYIYWDIQPRFCDTGTYSYQLQVARTPNPEDSEWEDVGTAVLDAAFLTDAVTPSYGYVLDKYYRVILTTEQGTYVSPIEGCFGPLKPLDWKKAKEITRKEILMHTYTSVPVTILKKKRYGEPCTHCSNEGAGGTINSQCPYCFGTGYLGGYHTPYSMQLMSLSPSRLMERHTSGNVATLNTASDRYQARALGIPELFNGDIIVDESTGQRFRVSAAPVAAQIRRVPLVRQVDASLLPVTDIVYDISTGTETNTQEINQPSSGCGSVLLNQSYGAANLLLYTDSHSKPIVGATVTVTDTSDSSLVGTTKTLADGVWETGFNVDPGTYAVSFSLTGHYGPDTITVTVTGDDIPEELVPDYNFDQTRTTLNYLNPFG